MTLQLELTDVKDLWGGQSPPTYLYVDGSQSGSLVFDLRKLPQIIKCSTKDHLTLILCGSKSKLQPQNGDIIGKQDFWASAFIDQNRYKWENQHQSYPYTMEYFNSKHEKQGELKFNVKYTQGLFYQGQILGANAIRKKLVPFYKGPCPTSNFYNFLDYIVSGEDRQFNIIQHVYKDY